MFVIVCFANFRGIIMFNKTFYPLKEPSMKQVNENNGISRRESIYELLKEQTTVYVKDLSQKFGVSDMTIRRDLHIMEEQGILVTHYGGATIRHPSSVIHTFDMRKESFFEAKAAIARRAVEFIKENDVIYLDPSTTVLLMTRYLPPLHHTVVTSSLAVMQECFHNPYITLYIAPGKYQDSNDGPMDMDTVTYLSNFHFNAAFLGTGFIDTVYGVTSTEMDCSIKQAVMKNSEQNILLVDHSKFGQHTMKKFGDIKDFNTIITDSDISDEDQYNILKEKVNLNIIQC